jgi:hypothetical protein
MNRKWLKTGGGSRLNRKWRWIQVEQEVAENWWIQVEQEVAENWWWIQAEQEVAEDNSSDCQTI